MTDKQLGDDIRLALYAAKEDFRPPKSRLNNVIARLERILADFDNYEA